MTQPPQSSEPRIDRHKLRKTRSRAALVAAACEYLAGPIGAEASVQQITNRADVGVGTFYNHFDNKSELFEAAIAHTLERFGVFFDAAMSEVDDPALLYANGIRMTLHLRETHRQMTDILMRLGFSALADDRALVPRALKGLHAAVDAGRLHIDDFDTAIACTAGSLLGCLHVLSRDNTADVGMVASELATNMLRMFGLPDAEARTLAATPLQLPGPTLRAAAGT